jgi:hypothetical protein
MFCNFLSVNTTVSSSFFYNASSLKSIKGDTLFGKGSCSSLFNNCENLENIDFTNYDFTECTSLTYSF